MPKYIQKWPNNRQFTSKYPKVSKKCRKIPKNIQNYQKKYQINRRDERATPLPIPLIRPSGNENQSK